MELEDLSWPAGLHLVLGGLVGSLNDGTREWRQNLELPSPEAVIWQPYAGAPSIGGLILHMAACEMYWLMDVAAQIAVPVEHPAWVYDSELDQYAGSWPVPPAQPIEWYFDIQDEIRGEMVKLVCEHNDPLTFHGEGKYSSSYQWILSHLVQHDSYHGGQAVMLHQMYKMHFPPTQ